VVVAGSTLLPRGSVTPTRHAATSITKTIADRTQVSAPAKATASPATTATTSVAATPVVPSVPVAAAATPAPSPSIATLVAEVESAGIVPASTWTWGVGDTTTQCGAIASGEATGCTFWSSGVERTVFSGTPSLALVAHEVANAETEADAVPSLLSEVASAAAGTSWSPTDAVASCLVAHFMGFQDNAAGAWQCPAALAATVADEIHQTVTTTQTTSVCGATSGVSSTVTFTASSGTMTVTATGVASQTVGAGVAVTVSGIGTFVATDTGGSVSESGVCQA
jgi:hypothetical protein